jgi:hypothetical protein
MSRQMQEGIHRMGEAAEVAKDKLSETFTGESTSKNVVKEKAHQSGNRGSETLNRLKDKAENVLKGGTANVGTTNRVDTTDRL